MYLLSKQGRGALLGFLRNLTPQVLLLSAGLVFFVQGWPQKNWWQLLLALALLVLLCMAVLANLDEFLDQAFSQTESLAAHRDSLRIIEPRVRKRIFMMIVHIWKNSPGTLIELFIALFVTYGAMFAVLNTAVRGAVSKLQ